MGYIYGLIVVGLLFVTLHYFTELNHKQKFGISLLLGLLVLFAYLYNSHSQAQQERILKSVRYTFIGKKNTPYYSDMVSVSACQ